MTFINNKKMNKQLNKKAAQRLKNVHSVQSYTGRTENMQTYIINFILSHVPSVTIERPKAEKGNIYVTKGRADLYPCYVAHTDTVHEIQPCYEVVNAHGQMYAQNPLTGELLGIGGDDKVGIFVAIEMLLKLDVCKVAFFRDEETGCNGSQEANMTFFDDVAFVLQCDRQGMGDFVTSIYGEQLCSNEFTEACESALIEYKRKPVDGGLTDVYQLKQNGLDVSCVNINCGYYNPHSNNEFIDVLEVFETLNFVEQITKDLNGNKWTHEPTQNDHYFMDGQRFIEESQTCPECGDVLMTDEISKDLFCIDCNMYLSDVIDILEDERRRGTERKTHIATYSNHSRKETEQEYRTWLNGDW